MCTIAKVSGSTDMPSRKIYLKTDYAWYILDQPSQEYAPYYAAFWTQQFIFHTLMTAASANRRLSYTDFVAALQESEEPVHVTGEPIRQEHVHSHSTASTTVIAVPRCLTCTFSSMHMFYPATRIFVNLTDG